MKWLWWCDSLYHCGVGSYIVICHEVIKRITLPDERIFGIILYGERITCLRLCMHWAPGNRINTNYQRIASCAGCLPRTADPRVSEAPLPPTAVSSVLTTRPWHIRKNRFPPAVWYHASGTTTGHFCIHIGPLINFVRFLLRWFGRM